MSNYRLSKLAQQDLENIWEYTLSEWSLDQAEKYIDGLLLCFTALADNRIKGKPIDHIRKGYLKTPFLKHYIFFRIASEGVVEIIRVLHVSMDIDKHL